MRATATRDRQINGLVAGPESVRDPRSEAAGSLSDLSESGSQVGGGWEDFLVM